MATEKTATVTMRVRLGDAEMEVTGPRDYVERKIDEFLKRSPVAIAAPAHSAPNAQVATPTPSVAGKPKSPAQFFRGASPRTDVDRVLVSAYYLEKFRELQSATSSEIKELIREAKSPPPTNTSDAINQNIRKGFLMTGGDREGKMVFVVTSDGESRVDEMTAKIGA